MFSNSKETANEKLKCEITNLREQCENICYIAQNEFNFISPMTPEEIEERTQCYVQALCKDIQSTETPIIDNEEILIDQFLNEITEKTEQLDELTIFTQALVRDVQTKIDRLKNQINIVEESKLIQEKETKQDCIDKIKQRFRTLKSHVRNVIHIKFNKDSSEIMNLLGELMQESVKKESDGYIPVTTENLPYIEMLLDRNIVKLNPYNNNEAKLSV